MAEPRKLTRWMKLRVAAVSAYVVVSVLSLAWALPGRGTQNALGAVIVVGQTAEGTVYVTVRNESRLPWHDAHLVADERFLFRAGDIVPGEAFDTRLREFEHIYRLIRPAGLYLWDDPSTLAPPVRFAAPGYWPNRIRLITEEGELEQSVARE